MKKRELASNTQAPYQQLGAAIRAERERLSITQQQLAELAGCGLTFVNQLERGKPGVRLEKLVQVLTVLGLSFALVRGKRPFEVRL
jgi:HTH-type transcriptional regulator / antitoxin HipB